MRTISAQEIKRRGISAVDDLLAEGPVHIITRNEPRYVVMDEARYEELVEAHHEAYVARVLASLADVAAGKARRFATVAELMEAIDAADDDDA
jgi:PHD/YefM family antitoxin component YafN of YafNO toxin-antitoxin module